MRIFKNLGLVIPLMGMASPALQAEKLYIEDAWRQIEMTPEGIVVSEAEIPGASVKAVMVSQVVDIDPETLAMVIEDVGNYSRFLKSAPGARGDLLEKTDGHLLGYQYLELPMISDRYYAFKMYRPDSASTRVDWELVPQQSLNEFSINERSGVYIDMGVGSWSMDKRHDGTYRVSYRLIMDPGGWIPDSVSDYFNRVSVVGIFKDAITETERRSSVERG